MAVSGVSSRGTARCPDPVTPNTPPEQPGPDEAEGSDDQLNDRYEAHPPPDSAPELDGQPKEQTPVPPDAEPPHRVSRGRAIAA
jgi:hypothetical protein